MLDAAALHPGRTAEAHLTSVAQSNGISRRRVTEMLQLTGLEAVANRRVKGLSLGMKQRAVTLANTPGHGPPADPLLPGVLSQEYAVLAVGVLGVLAFTAEFSTGLIRTDPCPPAPALGRPGRPLHPGRRRPAGHRAAPGHEPVHPGLVPAGPAGLACPDPAGLTLLAAAVAITRRDADPGAGP